MTHNNFINRMLKGFSRLFLEIRLIKALKRTHYSPSTSVEHSDVQLKLYAPNAICEYRNATFSAKEPDTLAWIDGFTEGAVFWDIGANVGLYSLYAAKKRNCQVFSFEPSVFNIEILARNIHLNSLQNLIAIIPIALSNKAGVSLFKQTSTAIGGALSVFGKNFNADGEEINSIFEYKTLGISLDLFSALFKMPLPNYIKIDVDGLEHYILEGGIEVLRGVQSVIVEINDNFEEQVQKSSNFLSQAGLRLEAKSYLGAGKFFNQLWVR